ncbi:MAG TPA: nucleotidyl transferase AbiEii/AbiGii toxin family protein [Spirochaetota bacterium]|nr:nucleotidyl transferase AbiEii/AbiGii toxin family protein [Spirochaetota bacterium]HRZ28339.1 nucleotidyl transferase AbiEii/AbiGii toxin family protein [Spirochaetota bacterium]HSA15267.1 nucleotidyl transferase AbiEii/AbiGii toxin family protein [Spirochaetota bacterium]
MKNKEIKNVPESVRRRLYNIAQESGRRFDAIALQYFQERFLYRLSVSAYRSSLVLKGALLLLVSDMTRFRPTGDIDFLGKGINNEPEQITIVIASIASIQADDGIVFDPGTVESFIIKEGADYEGVRVKLDVTLGTIRRKIQLDIGFGDVITNGPVEMDFPVLLDYPSPHVLCYSHESVIAEKIESIVKLNFYTSRVKDIYDIVFLSRCRSYDFHILSASIKATFEKRGTAISDAHVIFSDEFKNDVEKQQLWKAFCIKNNISKPERFSEVIKSLEAFLGPVFKDGFNKNRQWDKKTAEWVS